MSVKVNVPELRFAEFSGEWEEKRLGEVTTYVDYRGRAPIKTVKGHFLVTAKNIKKGFIDYECSKEYVAEKDYLNVMSKGIPEVGDILFTTEAPMGNVAQVDDKNIALAQRVIKFRSKKMLSNPYLLHYMLSAVFQNLISKKSIGTTVQGISGKELHRVKLSFPSIHEQEKIASFLGGVDERLEQLGKKQKLLEEYKKGVMQQIFSQELRFKAEDGSDYPEWVEKKLSNITKIYDGTHLTPKYVEQGVPFFSVEHLTRNQFIDTKYISEEVFEKENKRVKLEENDILMTKIGDIGTSKLIDWKVNASFYVSLALIKSQKGFNSSFLNQFIKSDFFQRQLHGKTLHVAFPKKINLGEIGQCIVHMPSLKEQTKIANFLSSLDEKIALTQEELNGTKEFKKALLQKMFV